MTKPGADQGLAAEVKSVVASDGVRLDYEVVGAGKPIVLLHGAFAGRAAFSRQRQLAERYRVILPSSRAHDRSDGRLPSNYGLGTTEVEDLCAVLDAEGLDRFHLVGHSSGGAVAFAFAHKFPQRVDQLVLIEPTLLALLHRADREVVARDFGALIVVGKTQGAPAALSAMMAWLGGDAWTKLGEEKRSARLQSMAHMAHIVLPHVQGLLDLEVTDADVKSLQSPTLLIYGSESYDFEAAIADRFRELRPDWKLLMVDRAGHNSYRDQPEIVNRAISDFLAS